MITCTENNTFIQIFCASVFIFTIYVFRVSFYYKHWTYCIRSQESESEKVWYISPIMTHRPWNYPLFKCWYIYVHMDEVAFFITSRPQQKMCSTFLLRFNNTSKTGHTINPMTWWFCISSLETIELDQIRFILTFVEDWYLIWFTRDVEPGISRPCRRNSDANVPFPLLKPVYKLYMSWK